MLTIAAELRDAIVAHARRDHPVEACGLVCGPAGGDHAVRFVPVANDANSRTFYEFGSADLLALYTDMAKRGEDPIVIYHSHTASPAYPSPTDVSLAFEPDAHYVIVSTMACGNGPGQVEFRSFRIVDAQIREEEVVVVD
ncbi:MAG: M67 family metallopeptidase [Candidatus Nanopelagicales bacterium]|nr:M67 family metallopeptidase [Candidatus Nanopelagicales bacterium]MDZ4249083.1 M67 family metallopeptidase [Candidatus Nanopelagicales bacterium]MDZ7577252.1 M67 family metallopeptidase [Candidatus Nanopelagicales bacterium]